LKIELRPFDVHLAAFVANCRSVSALRNGRELEAGRRDLGFERHVEGAIGEYSVAIGADRCWRPIGNRLDTDLGDIGGELQVKTTTRPNGCLIVRPHDPPQFAYVLVELDLRNLVANIRGWAPGRQAKQARYWRERNPAGGVHRAAYFVPPDELLELWPL
jgi:hypothetical protein